MQKTMVSARIMPPLYYLMSYSLIRLVFMPQAMLSLDLVRHSILVHRVSL